MGGTDMDLSGLMKKPGKGLSSTVCAVSDACPNIICRVSKVVLGRPSDLQAHEVLPWGGPGQVAEREHVHLAEQQTSGGGTGYDDELAE